MRDGPFINRYLITALADDTTVRMQAWGDSGLQPLLLEDTLAADAVTSAPLLNSGEGLDRLHSAFLIVDKPFRLGLMGALDGSVPSDHDPDADVPMEAGTYFIGAAAKNGIGAIGGGGSGGSSAAQLGELLDTGARTVTTESGEQPSDGNGGIFVVVDVTEVPAGAPSLDVAVIVTDPVTGKELRLNDALDGVAYDPITAVGTYLFTLGPDCWIEQVGHIYQATPTRKPPGAWKVSVAHTGVEPVTYQVSGGTF